MKKFLWIGICILFLMFIATQRVVAQTPPSQPSPSPSAAPDDPPLAPLTTTGQPFANGSKSGCAIAGGSCSLKNGTQGICADNGQGSGVCTPANPTIDPLFAVGNCKPNSLCHVPPEKVGRRNNIGQDSTKNCGTTDCTGDLWTVVQKWVGDVKPQSVYHYGTEQLTKFGHQAQDACFSDLAPAQIQDMTLHDVQPKPYCMTSRLCVYNPVTHELVANFLTEETWCSDDPPGRIPLIEGTRWCASYMTHYVSPQGANMQLPLTSVQKMGALPCGAKLDDGRVIDEPEINYVKKNYYGENDITHIEITILADMVSVISKVINGVTQQIFTAHESTPAVEVGSAENSMAASLAGISFTVTQEDLAPFAYPNPAGKEALTKVGGLWNVYRNDAYDPAFKSKTDAIYDSQDWYYGIAGTGNIKSPTLQAMNARQETAQLFGNCAITNAAMQPKIFKNQCNQHWIAPASETTPSTPPSPENLRGTETAPTTPIKPDAVPATAPSSYSGLASSVPACVLNAVATIEGAFEGGTSCKPDVCGAVGPFQISTGQCSKACHASSCPNELPKGTSASSVCNWDTAANLAASILIGKANYFGYNLTNADPTTQKDAIIIAGDSYNGTTNTISRLVSSTGQPLTYGEWVYAHCDPTYTTHVNHSFPPAGGGTTF